MTKLSCYYKSNLPRVIYSLNHIFGRGCILYVYNSALS
nr:MAG TPA: hypothetical protein [Caudoviricetes sp.]